MEGLAEKFITASGQVAIPPGTGAPATTPFAGGTVQATVDAGSTYDTNTFANAMRPIAGATFAYTGDPAFVLTAAGCILTYAIGQPIRTFLFVLSSHVEATTPPNNGTLGFAVSINGDFIGTPIFANNPLVIAGRGIGEMIANGACSCTCQRRVLLNPGDTVRPIAGMFAGTTSLNIHGLSLSITEVDT